MNLTLIKDNKTVLLQLEQCIVNMPIEAYITSKPLLNNSTIGMHIRHIIEFYECLLQGAHSGTINYDARARNLDLEVDKKFAIACLHAIIAHIENCNLHQDLYLQTNDNSVKMPTSFSRELYYMLEHCTHHLAIIKIILNQYWPEVALPENFGIAQSTLKHQQQCAQ